jgi:hypothetical protein
LEKNRLAERKGGHFVYENPGKVVVPDEAAASYIPENERFQKDFAMEDKVARDRYRATVEQQFEEKRELNLKMEEARWQKMEEEKEIEEKVWEEKRANNRTNLSSVAYNPLTLKYQDDDQGALLQYEDDHREWRKAVRSKDLYTQINRNGINPLTGDSLRVIHVPDAPDYPGKHQR